MTETNTMAETNTRWSIKGTEIVSCNCNWGCPCQFNSRPSQGHCGGVVAVQIDEGRYGDVRLDGLRVVHIVAWPGAIHEGRGEHQLIIDERADERQRNALHRIFMGQDTEPGATVWAIFATTYDKIHDPIYRPIDYEFDQDARTGRVRIPDMLEAVTEPILNPVTGKPHRARITLPMGIEYHEAEAASGRVRTMNLPIAHDMENRHSHLARIEMTSQGVAH